MKRRDVQRKHRDRPKEKNRQKKLKELKAHNIKAMTVCQDCGARSLKKDTEFCDPYSHELYGEIIPMTLCDKCAWERYLDV